MKVVQLTPLGLSVSRYGIPRRLLSHWDSRKPKSRDDVGENLTLSLFCVLLMASNTLETKIRLRITDTQKTWSQASWNDVYSLSVDENGNVFASKTYEDDHPAFDVFHDFEHLNLVDIPKRVAAVMQQYVDSNVVSWPNSYPTQQANVEREEVHITISNGDTYTFSVYDGKHVRVKQGKQPIRIDNVPAKFEQEAKTYIPQGVQFL